MTPKNCLSCESYMRCSDPAKSFIFWCKSYRSSAQATARHNDIMQQVSDQLPDMRNVILTPDVVERSASIEARVHAALSSSRFLPQDLMADDSHFEEAKNVIHWCMDPTMLAMRPFVRQAIILAEIFSEYCPRCSDSEWMATAPVDASLETMLSKVSMFEWGVCPNCGTGRSDCMRDGRLTVRTEGAVCAGQRGGKSALTVQAHSYIIHRALKMGRPAQVYNVLRGQTLQGTFTALTYAQAKDTLWDTLYNFLIEAPWFQEYHKWLGEEGARTGKELFKLNDTFVSYKHRLIDYYPAGPDKRVLRGRTRIAASIDELGWFPNDVSSLKNVKMNAQEVYKALANSLVTVRSAARRHLARGVDNTLQGLFINVSSPSHARDMIMEKVRQSAIDRRIYGIRIPTWELNPTVTKDDLSQEFLEDPVKALRDFGAQPPMSSNPFFTKDEPVENCMVLKPQTVRMTYKTHKLRNGDRERYAVLEGLKGNNYPAVLAVDAGFAHNSFGVSVVQNLPKYGLSVPLMLELQPKPGCPLNYSLCYKHILTPIMEAFNICAMAADRWQSLKLLSDAEIEFDLQKITYSLKYADMCDVRQYIYDEEIALRKPSMPIADIKEFNPSDYPRQFENDPYAHFYLQCCTVQDASTQVLKGENLTDDLWRATALGVTVFLNPKYAELLTAVEPEEKKPQGNIESRVFMAKMSGVAPGSGAHMPGGCQSSRVFIAPRR